MKHLHPHKLDGKKKQRIISAVLRWYKNNGRTLPWRDHPNPYHILVSEIMLQQTQIRRVLEKYPLFLRQFPSFKKLASAGTAEVIRAWQGMGYNNRSVRLQETALIVVRNYGGMLPSDIETLMHFPGIGRYTAHAIACFAFGQRVPVVDTNIARILQRLFPHQNGRANAERIWEIAETLLPAKQVHDWNQALMDLGSSVCLARNPHCTICPLKGNCPSAFAPQQSRDGKKKNEPGRYGVPNRLHRGKIVAVLRTLAGKRSISIDNLGKKILIHYTKRDRPWLAALLKQMSNDGVASLKVRNGIIFTALPE
ncbi:MAG: A/G-specific adenine glycosylase [bacterium]